MVLGLVGEVADEDLPEPGDQLRLGRAGELVELAVGLEEGLLNQVGRVEPGPQGAVDQRAGHKPEVVAVKLQQPAPRRVVAGSGRPQKLLGAHLRGGHRTLPCALIGPSSATSCTLISTSPMGNRWRFNELLPRWHIVLGLIITSDRLPRVTVHEPMVTNVE